MRRTHRPRGLVVVVAGPDGVGKSSLATSLLSSHPRRGPTLWVHSRYNVLPSRSLEPTDEPTRGSPYNRVLATLKVLFLFLDQLLGTALRARPIIRAGGWVIVERGWWDMVVDPARYRLRSGRLPALFGRVVPPPDLVLLLEGKGDMVYERKHELSPSEVDDQSRTWRSVLPPRLPTVVVDATLPPGVVLERSLVAVEQALLQPRRNSRAAARRARATAGPGSPTDA